MSETYKICDKVNNILVVTMIGLFIVAMICGNGSLSIISGTCWIAATIVSILALLCKECFSEFHDGLCEEDEEA